MCTVELHFYLLTYQDWLRVQYIFSSLLKFCLDNLLAIKVDPNLLFRYVFSEIVYQFWKNQNLKNVFEQV